MHWFIFDSSVILFILLNAKHVCQSTQNESTTDIPSQRWGDIYVVPPNAKHKSTIIFLHGIGESGKAWTELIKHVCHPGMKIICPQANKLPIEIVGEKNKTWASSWFRRGDEDLHNFENVDDINNVTKYIEDLVTKEINEGLPPKQIILGGFSQGATVAINVIAKYPKKLGGLMAFSGWLPLGRTFIQSFNQDNRDIPILQAHGDEDDVVPVKLANITAFALGKISNNVTYKFYTGIKHIISQEVVGDMRKFINAHIEK